MRYENPETQQKEAPKPRRQPPKNGERHAIPLLVNNARINNTIPDDVIDQLHRTYPPMVPTPTEEYMVCKTGRGNQEALYLRTSSGDDKLRVATNNFLRDLHIYVALHAMQPAIGYGLGPERPDPTHLGAMVDQHNTLNGPPTRTRRNGNHGSGYQRVLPGLRHMEGIN